MFYCWLFCFSTAQVCALCVCVHVCASCVLVSVFCVFECLIMYVRVCCVFTCQLFRAHIGARGGFLHMCCVSFLSFCVFGCFRLHWGSPENRKNMITVDQACIRLWDVHAATSEAQPTQTVHLGDLQRLVCSAWDPRDENRVYAASEKSVDTVDIRAGKLRMESSILCCFAVSCVIQSCVSKGIACW